MVYPFLLTALLELSMIISEGLQPKATSRVLWGKKRAGFCPEGGQITMDPEIVIQMLVS